MIILRIATYITEYFVQHNWIEPEEMDLFHYSVEKRCSTLIVFVPAFLLAVYLTSVLSAITFFLSFSYLRLYTNGFHAKSIHGCFVFSIVLEVVFLGFIYPIIRTAPMFSLVVCTISLTIILLLAPYDHPNMSLTSDELSACHHIVVHRVITVFLGVSFIWILNLSTIACSVITGIAMVAFLLCLAYIQKGRKLND